MQNPLSKHDIRIYRIILIIALSMVFISAFYANESFNFVNAQNSQVGWDLQNSSTNETLRGVISKNLNTSWVVGDNGLILKTENKGATWINENISKEVNLYSIDFFNDSLMAVGSKGAIFRKNLSTDWEDISNSNDNLYRSISIPFANNATFNGTIAFIAGEKGEIWKTIDGGSNWTLLTTGTTVNLYDIDFINSTHGLAVGEKSTIIGTTNGGITWEIRDPEIETEEILRSVFYYSARKAYIVGDNGVFLTSVAQGNTAASWDWIVMLTNTNIQFNAIFASSQSRMWIVGSNATVLYSTDAWGTHSEQILDIKDSSVILFDISMEKGTHGWVVGSKGIILNTDDRGIAPTVGIKVADYSDFNLFFDYVTPLLMDGFVGMLKIIFFSMILGFVLGITIALSKTVDNFILNLIGTIYTDIIRNTPLLVQLFIIYFGLPELNIDVSFDGRIEREFMSAILGLGINSGAYQAEIIRSGIQAIPSGQMEAGRSVGLTYFQTMRLVILPQALRLTIPPLGNEMVNLTLNSALVSVIGYFELTRAGRLIIATTFMNFETWGFVLLYYFVITYSLTNLLRWIERKSKIPGLGAD